MNGAAFDPNSTITTFYDAFMQGHVNITQSAIQPDSVCEKIIRLFEVYELYEEPFESAELGIKHALWHHSKLEPHDCPFNISILSDSAQNPSYFSQFEEFTTDCQICRNEPAVTIPTEPSDSAQKPPYFSQFAEFTIEPAVTIPPDKICQEIFTEISCSSQGGTNKESKPYKAHLLWHHSKLDAHECSETQKIITTIVLASADPASYGRFISSCQYCKSEMESDLLTLDDLYD